LLGGWSLLSLKFFRKGLHHQELTTMAESNDSVSVDMEKIFLGGKV